MEIGKVFAQAITNNQNSQATPTLANAITAICADAFTHPHVIQGDSEFAGGDFRSWCAQNNVQFIRSTSYTPTSNEKVERANREMRKKIKAGLIHNNNLIWRPHLQKYVMNINNQQNSRTKLTPNQLWTQ